MQLKTVIFSFNIQFYENVCTESVQSRCVYFDFEYTNKHKEFVPINRHFIRLTNYILVELIYVRISIRYAILNPNDLLT